MKRALLFLIISFIVAFPISSYGVGGLSNTKILVPSAKTVPSTAYEIGLSSSFTFMDEDDAENFGFGFRFTKGLLSNLEAGFSVSYLTYEDADSKDSDYNFGDIATGLKYRFLETSNGLSLAYQGGITFPTSTRDNDTNWVFEPAGLIATVDFTDTISVDSSIGLVFQEAEDSADVFGVNSDIGLGVLLDGFFKPAIELNYQYADPDGLNSSDLLILTGGFVAYFRNVALTMGLGKDVYSDNTPDDIYTLTATLTFALGQ